MTIEEIRAKLNEKEYDFLREDEHLGKNIALITLGGSHAYGTNIATSDLDIRGFAVPTRRDIILGKHFDQIEERNTDTVMYELSKFLKLLCECNPNTIEILGNRPEAYLYVSKYGQMLLDNKSLFLSKRAIRSFAGYAEQQLRRLENKVAREMEQARKEEHILATIQNAKYAFCERYPIQNINLYIDESPDPNMDTEIFFDFYGEHLSLRDFNSMLDEMKNIVTSYNKIGERNEKAMLHFKIQKHMMHLIRLYMMGIDVIERGEIITYREKEHDLLMDIRNAKYIYKNSEPIPEFFELLDEYKKKFEKAKENTILPDNVDMKKVEELKYAILDEIIKETGD